jgi:predicted nuclease of predicted toxin-antitoxin system
MRFLVDMPVSPRVAAWLTEQGHDAVHAADRGLGQAADRELLDRAAQEERIVITADTDFPQLLALSRATIPGVILLRGGHYSASETIELLRKALDASAPGDLATSICVVDRQRIRYRRLPVI